MGATARGPSAHLHSLALRSLTGTALARSASASVHRTPRTCGSGQVCGLPAQCRTPSRCPIGRHTCASAVGARRQCKFASGASGGPGRIVPTQHPPAPHPPAARRTPSRCPIGRHTCASAVGARRQCKFASGASGGPGCTRRDQGREAPRSPRGLEPAGRRPGRGARRPERGGPLGTRQLKRRVLVGRSGNSSQALSDASRLSRRRRPDGRRRS